MHEAVSERSAPAAVTGVEPSEVDDTGCDEVVVKMQCHLHTRVSYSRHDKEERVYVLDKLWEPRFSLAASVVV